MATLRSKGVVIDGPRKVRITDNEVGEPDENQVLLRVDNVNLCGSDVHLFMGATKVPTGIPSILVTSGRHRW